MRLCHGFFLGNWLTPVTVRAEPGTSNPILLNEWGECTENTWVNQWAMWLIGYQRGLASVAKFSGPQEGLFRWWRRPLALTVLKQTAGNGLQLVPEDFRVKTEKGRRGLGNENCSLGIKEMCYKGRAQNPEHRRKGRKGQRGRQSREQRSLEDRKESIAEDSHMGSDDDGTGEGTVGSAKWQRKRTASTSS